MKPEYKGLLEENELSFTRVAGMLCRFPRAGDLKNLDHLEPSYKDHEKNGGGFFIPVISTRNKIVVR